MVWVCPNCSTSNEEEAERCFVCGMDRPSSEETEPETDEEVKIVFSDSEAFKTSLSSFFRRLRKKKGTAGTTGSRAPETPEALRDGRDTDGEGTYSDSDGYESYGDLPEIDLAEPWPEHRIRFNAEMIGSKGFVRSEQKIMGGVKGYYFYKEDGSGQFIRQEMLLIQKMARKI